MESISKLDNLYSDILNFQPRAQDLRRAKIIEAVIEIVSTRGFDELTFESVGKEVGMARSHVVYYFPKREALVEATMRFVASYAQRTIVAHFDNLTDWREMLTKYIEGNFDWIEQQPKHATVFMLLYYQSSFKKKYRELHTQIREVGAKRIRAILELGTRSRQKKRNIPLLAQTIQAVVTGFLLEAITTDKKTHFKRLRSEAVQVAHHMVQTYSA